jgi:hypothetical protein
MATLLRLNRDEAVISKGIIHNVSKAAEPKSPAGGERHNFSDEQPTVADLVLPGTGHKFSDEFAGLLIALGGEREISHETVHDKRGNPACRISG